MKRRRWVGVVVALACGGAVAPLACSPSKGALILAISTDMQTPKDIDLVGIYVATDSQPKFDFLTRVSPAGILTLPSTLAIVEPDKQGAQVRIRVTAFKGQQAMILRDVLTTVPHQRTALMRVPLNFLDYGTASGTVPSQYLPGGPSGAPDGDTQWDPTNDPTNPTPVTSVCDFTQGLTSVNGTCASATIDSSHLPDYSDGLVYGGGNANSGNCFDVGQCFSGAMQVTNLDTGGCSFPLPSGADPNKLNVALVTNGGAGECIGGGNCYVPVEQDQNEGWYVSGNLVEMVPGVCVRLQKSKAQIYVSSGACAPKVESDPVCEPSAPKDAGSPGADYCAWVQAVDQLCGKASSSCDQNCPSWINYYATSWLEGWTSCWTPASYCGALDDGGGIAYGSDAGAVIASCLYDSYRNVQLSAAQQQLAADFCKQCPDGASSVRPQSCSRFWWTCFSDWFGGATGQADGSYTCSECVFGPSSCNGPNCDACGNAYYDLVAYSDQVIAAIDRQCTGSAAPTDSGFTDCATAFSDCASNVIASVIPNTTCEAGAGGGDGSLGTTPDGG